MITEDYVSFETAKLLKEKEFNEPCYACYINKELSHYDYLSTNFELIDDVISAPTLQMAMKWLREAHGTSIEITSTGYLVDNDVEWECNIKAGHRLYFKHITCEKSFEFVAEKALKYCLEYLI